MRMLIAAVAAVLPQPLKRFVYRHAFGWSVHPTAVIGCCLIDVEHLVVDADVRVSHFNVIKGCEHVHLSEGALIGAFNWISARSRASGGYPNSPQRRPRFTMGRHSALTMRHVIDCSDEVRLGDLATVAGMRSQVLTHAIDLDRAVQVTSPVVIGDHALVLSGCIILAGSVVPPRSVIAAGAVVTSDLGAAGQLYGGVPARPIKAISTTAAYFDRHSAYVD